MKKLSLFLALLFIMSVCSACGPQTSEHTDSHSLPAENSLTGSLSNGDVSDSATDSVQGNNSAADEEFEILEKKYVEATLEDVFYADKLSVILQPAYSVNVRTEGYFVDVGCVQVVNSVLLPNKTRQYLLRLDKTSKQNVLDMIALLMEREDVYSAEPDWVVKVEDIPEEELPVYEKEHAVVTLEDDFSPNEVTVTLQPAYSKDRKTAEYFADIGCVEVGSSFYKPNEKTRWYCLRLDKESKQNVIDMIAVLMEREDVFRAEPNWYLTYSDAPADLDYLHL